MKRSILRAALLALTLSGAALAADIPSYVTRAVGDTTRPRADTDRYALRLPAETIAFAGVKPGMKVAELFPGGGYFTRPLSDVVGPHGGTGEAQIAALHRIEKSQVIREVEAAGFKRVAQGDALHRPADDHTESVFDKSIQGHTDQFMLKFVRP